VTQQHLKHAVQPGGRPKPTWIRAHLILLICVVLVLSVAVALAAVRLTSTPSPPVHLGPVRYVGVYVRGAPTSYAGVDQFSQEIGTQPDVASYYSSWGEPFQGGFARTAARHGATPLVQMNPANVSLAAIASGAYDTYLRSFADAVRSYHHPVIVGFGHEMNGWWFSWGYRHTSPQTFVAAWRHIVTLFRARGATNATWLWTINIVDPHGGIRPPAPWWPGSSYVTWVGIDGYYFKSSWSFAPLFGPTIKAVKAITKDPILIAETGAGRIAGQTAKIPDLFAGIRSYGLLGFVWFDAVAIQDWRLEGPSAFRAFHQGMKSYKRSTP